MSDDFPDRLFPTTRILNLKCSGSTSRTEELNSRREGLVRFGRLGPAFGSTALTGVLGLLLDEAMDDFALDLWDGTGGKSSLTVMGGFCGFDFDLLRGSSCIGTSLIRGDSRPKVVLELTPDRPCRDVAVATGGGSTVLQLEQIPIGTTKD
jgi:hypothetical protein